MGIVDISCFFNYHNSQFVPATKQKKISRNLLNQIKINIQGLENGFSFWNFVYHDIGFGSILFRISRFPKLETWSKRYRNYSTQRIFHELSWEMCKWICTCVAMVSF